MPVADADVIFVGKVTDDKGEMGANGRLHVIKSLERANHVFKKAGGKWLLWHTDVVS